LRRRCWAEAGKGVNSHRPRLSKENEDKGQDGEKRSPEVTDSGASIIRGYGQMDVRGGL